MTTKRALPTRAAPSTVVDVLDAALQRDGGHAFCRCDSRDVTVAGLHQASMCVAAALRAWGIAAGDRVAIMMANVPEFLHVWFAIVRIRAIEVPVHGAHRGPLLEHILAESGARILFCDAEFLSRLLDVANDTLERIVVRGEFEGDRLRGLPVHAIADALHEPPLTDPPRVEPDDVSCLLYTSGTTGPSKGVVLTHSANLQLARANIELMEYTAEDVLFTVFPLFHVNAKFTSVVSTLLCGARLVLDERFSASRFWDRLRQERVTSFNYMGSMLTILNNQPPAPDDRSHHVTRAYGGAAPAAIWRDFELRFGVRLHEHYGMTEIGIATQNTRTDRREGSIGRAAPAFEVRIGDEHDFDALVGEVGEIQVRPRLPGIILREYWRRPDATIAAVRNLWFHTGDRGRMDADGWFYYVDRLADSIRRRGENVSSFELETVVNAFASTLESAAYGVPSDVGEDDVMVAVVPRPGVEFDVEALLAHCERQLAYFAVPRYVRLVDALPKTPSQRVQKFVLREQGVTPDTFDRPPVRPAAKPASG